MKLTSRHVQNVRGVFASTFTVGLNNKGMINADYLTHYLPLSGWFTNGRRKLSWQTADLRGDYYMNWIIWLLHCGLNNMRLTEIAYSYRKNELLGTLCHSPSRIMHTGPVFIDLGILKLDNINHYVLQLFMLRFHTIKLPALFDDMFTIHINIHSDDTRCRFHLHVPLPKTKLVKMSVRYIGVTRSNYIYIYSIYLLQFVCL